MQIPTPAAAAALLKPYLSAPERPENTLRYEELMGFLYAVAACPERVEPDEWLPVVFGGEGRLELDGAGDEEAVAAIFTLYNDVDAQMQEDAAALPADCEPLEEPLANFGPAAPLGRWANGFLLGATWLSESWDALLPEEWDEEFGVCAMALSFFANRELADSYLKEVEQERPQTLEYLAQSVLDVLPEAVQSYAEMGRAIGNAVDEMREEHPAKAVKIGRNEPCPCGSGKKYKKCCGAVHEPE